MTTTPRQNPSPPPPSPPIQTHPDSNPAWQLLLQRTRYRQYGDILAGYETTDPDLNQLLDIPPHDD